MSVHVYVLIQTDVGKAADVTRLAREIDGVVSADNVTGPYDVIALLESASIDDLGRLVVSQVQRIEGITRTVTCPVINF